MGGGGLPMPGSFGPFFCQATVLKMAIFYSNFTVIVCFLVIFAKIIIIIIIETIIIITKTKFGHTRKTSFLTSKKEDQVARIGVRKGGGLGDSGNARKKMFFSIDVFPQSYVCVINGSIRRKANMINR